MCHQSRGHTECVGEWPSPHPTCRRSASCSHLNMHSSGTVLNSTLTINPEQHTNPSPLNAEKQTCPPGQDLRLGHLPSPWHPYLSHPASGTRARERRREPLSKGTRTTRGPFVEAFHYEGAADVCASGAFASVRREPRSFAISVGGHVIAIRRPMQSPSMNSVLFSPSGPSVLDAGVCRFRS